MMSGNDKSLNWQTVIALGGLAVSLFGNWIQYQTVLGKKTELAQAQQKLDGYFDEQRQRERARDDRKEELESRMAKLDKSISDAEDDARRGVAGLQFAPLDQKAMALEVINDATNHKKELQKKKEELQDKIDDLPIN
jgi:putative aminopeptidase FrvX